MTFASYGGLYQEGLKKAWFEPIAQKLGVAIRENTLSGMGEVRAQVMAGSVRWDLVERARSQCM